MNICIVYVKNCGLCTESWRAPLVNLSFSNIISLCQSYLYLATTSYMTENISLYFIWLKFCTRMRCFVRSFEESSCKKSQMLVMLIILYHLLTVDVLSNVLFLNTVFTNFAICRSISQLSEVSGFICWCHNFIMDI